MARRKPALSTQLKQAQARIEELENSLKHEKDMRKYENDARTKCEYELDQVHAFLDTMPDIVPPREPDNGKYGYKNTAMTRLAAWLALRDTKV